MNPHYGDFDTYHMAASAIDEAMRNAVAVGADPAKIAILDNFCWGYTDRAETLGSLVRAAIACQDMAITLGTPFVSGKDSLNNEFSFDNADGQRETISIPPSLLISAMGQIDDVTKSVTMDAKETGNVVFLAGITKNELGGSHLALVRDLDGGHVPEVDSELAKQTFATIHEAIQNGWIRSCLISAKVTAVAAAEMAMAGNLMNLDLSQAANDLNSTQILFSESNTRFLIETTPENADEFHRLLQSANVPVGRLGTIDSSGELVVTCEGTVVLQVDLDEAKPLGKPLDWS